MTSQNMEPKLRQNCLNFVELLAQNIALISPTMTAARPVTDSEATAKSAAAPRTKGTTARPCGCLVILVGILIGVLIGCCIPS